MSKFDFLTLADRLKELPYAGVTLRDHNAVAYRFPHDPHCNRVARQVHGCEWRQDLRAYVFTARSEEQVQAIIDGLRKLHDAVQAAKRENSIEVDVLMAKAAHKAVKP